MCNMDKHTLCSKNYVVDNFRQRGVVRERKTTSSVPPRLPPLEIRLLPRSISVYSILRGEMSRTPSEHCTIARKVLGAFHVVRLLCPSPFPLVPSKTNKGRSRRQRKRPLINPARPTSRPLHTATRLLSSPLLPVPSLPLSHLQKLDGVLEEVDKGGRVAREPQRCQQTHMRYQTALESPEPRQRQQRAQLPHGVRNSSRAALAKYQLGMFALDVLLAVGEHQGCWGRGGCVCAQYHAWP